jgi:hypothetical protein
MSSAWRCEHHGEVSPVRVVAPLQDGTVAAIAHGSRVPVWQLAAPPPAWTLGGVAVAGDERATTAVALGWNGPSPLGGSADLVIVAEEPGVGLGAHYAGLPGLDAGDCAQGAPDEHVELRGHPVALWCCAEAPTDRLAFVGEADGAWLWLVLWPSSADALLAERLVLADARERQIPQQRGAAHRRLALL